MGKAGQALKQTLKLHGIGQSHLAKKMGVERPVVFRWFHGQTDPTAETVVQIARALKSINPVAASNFIDLYLGEFIAPPSLGENPPRLLTSDTVNVPALAQLFYEAHGSYKYLFFLSLLDILESRRFEITCPISFIDLAQEIITNAWISYGYFKLSLGTKDCVTRQLTAILQENNQRYLESFQKDKTRLKSILGKTDYRSLLRYTARTGVYQLVYPWFREESQELKRKALNQAILYFSSSQYHKIKPLYVFDGERVEDCTAIVMTSDWVNYFKSHFRIVQGWAAWHWLQYLQIHNPTTLNLVNKLFISSGDDDLALQTKFWKSVMNHHPLRCFYCGELLNLKTLGLDHYLPRPFVAHDHIWNLIPISRSLPTPRGNNIPSDHYLREFVGLHHLALTTNHQHLPKTVWEKVIISYFNDLDLENENDLLDQQKLFNAYETTFNSLKTLALRQGFEDGWTYSL
ncbi:MAG: helix-turn-helix domain-containing protein [Synechocystis sp.]|nr:helix-turn-helix domain-containing protein [Synechocystis sp.]